MARAFDGTNDKIDCAADASIGGFATRTVAFWVRRGAINVRQILVAKDNNTSAWSTSFGNSTDTVADPLRLIQGFSTTAGLWYGSTSFTSTTALNHVVFTYDNSSDANQPSMYVNGVAETITEDGTFTGVGTATADTTDPLLMGENSAGGDDLNGDLGWVCYDNAIWDAAQINRHRWWGRIGGGVEVLHPLVTDKLANEGTATANGTASGTTVASLPRVMRPGCGGW